MLQQFKPKNSEFVLPEEQRRVRMVRFLLQADLCTIQGTSEELQLDCNSVCDPSHLFGEKQDRFLTGFKIAVRTGL